MAKIIFYDKEIKYNLPDYSIELLKKLEQDGHEVLVCIGSPNNF